MPFVQRARRGNYAIITALGMSAIFGFGALAIDVSYGRLVQAQLQAGTDAAAHAGIMMLDGTEEGMVAAVVAAGEVAAANRAGGEPLNLSAMGPIQGTIELGMWDADLQLFTVSEDPEEVQAVRVRTEHEDAALWLASIVFEQELRPSASAIAVRDVPGAGAVDCFLPWAIPSCLIEDIYGTEGIQDVDLILNPAGMDNAGWARPDANPNANWARDQIEDCEGDGGVELGDFVELNNGVLNSALKAAESAVEESDTTWDPEVWGALPDQHETSTVDEDLYGGTLEGPFIVFENDSYCGGGGGDWTGQEEIVAFVWGSIYDVTATGPAEGKNIRARVNTGADQDFGTKGGGPDWGVQTVRFAIVR